MTNEVQAALWGAVIGGLLTFLSTYFIDIKQKRERKKTAIELYRFFNSEWLRAESYDRGKASQKQYYMLLMKLADQIRETILLAPCENVIKSFLRYTSTLHQLNEFLQDGKLGLINWPIEEMQKIFSEFEKHSEEENCCHSQR